LERRRSTADAAAQAETKRGRPRPDPLAKVTAPLHAWFTAEPWRTSRQLLERLQAEQPGMYSDGLLRTLQRRLKIWRSEIAHTMVFGAINSQPAVEGNASGPAVLAGGRTGASPSLTARAKAWQKEGLGNI
jgi:hypothetical protein